MKFREVATPLEGERLVAVDPTPAPFVDAAWRRERFVTGRTISAAALDHEQGIRAARVALQARRLLPGVVSGLRVSVSPTGTSRLVLEPGLGIARSGEDVVIPTRTTFDPLALPLRPPAGGAEVRLDAWLAARTPTSPGTAVLVAQPVRVEESGEGDSACERDPEAEPFEDWRWVDGARLLWVPITPEVGTAVAAALAAPVLASWRNQVAWAIFDDEPRGLPWDNLGVALALCAFDNISRVAFIDHAAVARRGGERPVDSDRVIPRNPSVYARFDQVCDQLADEDLPTGFALSSRLRRLPPVGVLPRDVFNLVGRTSTVFPADWGVSAAPIPVDQLEEVIRVSAELEPYRIDTPLETIKLFVPVDPRWYEPDLLRVADVRPEFFDEAEEARDRRDDQLRRRAELQARIRALTGALRGADKVETFPEDASTDRAAELVAEDVLWSNPQTLASFDFLGARSVAGTLSVTADIVNGLALAMLQDAATATSVGSILNALGATTPIAIGATLGSFVARQGFGFAVPGAPPLGFARVSGSRLITATTGRLVCHLGVLGVQDLDAYVALGTTTPLVILALGADELALEEMGWRRRREMFLPEIFVLSGSEAVARERLLDVRVRLTGSAATTPVGTPTITGALSLTERELVVELPAASSNAALTARLLAVDNQLAIAEDAELRFRRAILGGRVGVLLAGPDPDAHHRVRATVETIRRLQAHVARGASEQELLSEVGGSAELPYGTEPTPFGLGSTTVQSLVDALVALKTTLPERQVAGNTVAPEIPVVSSTELGRLVQYGVDGLIELLTEKINRASDIVDLGFVQVQAAVYRVREQILGRDAAQKMAASPILGEVADVLDADASPEQVAKFFDALRDAASPSTPSTTVITGAMTSVVPKYVLEQEALSFQLSDLRAVTVAAATFVPPAPTVTAPPAQTTTLLNGTVHNSTFLAAVLAPTATTTSTNVRNLLASGTTKRTGRK